MDEQRGHTKLGMFEEELDKLDLVPTIIRGKADMQEAALIVKNARPELALNGKDCSSAVRL